MPVEYGVYTAAYGTLIYSLTGSSKELSIGPA